MADRAYTVREIDDLRRVCENLWLFGPEYFRRDKDGILSHSSGSFKPHEKDIGVEQLVRTYMIAGIVGSDIVAEYSK